MRNLLILLSMVIAGYSYGQENITFQKPSEEILKLADFQRPPSVFMDSKKETLIFVYRATYKTLEELNQEDLKLAGLRIDPKTNISSTISFVNGLKVKRKSDKVEQTPKGLPENLKLAHFGLSPNEKYLSFTNTVANGVELWIVDLTSLNAKKISTNFLNANMGNPYVWLKDSKTLVAQVLPKDKGGLKNKKEDLPSGPTISVSTGEVSQNRTYQDMLKNLLDEENFVTLGTSELVKIDLNGNQSLFAEKAIYSEISVSPNGEYILISTIHKPFSYMVPYYRFPMKEVVYSVEGELIKEVNDVPLNEILPKGFSSVRKGKRNMTWRADAPATLYYVEALDEGDQSVEVAHRDEVFLWEAPFATSPKSIFKTVNRYSGITWGNEENAFVTEFWYDTRNIKQHWLNPKTGESKLFSDRNYQDIYSNPGSFHTVKNEYARNVVEIIGNKAHLIGEGYTKEGQFPFIDELDLKTLKSKRLYTVKTTTKKEDVIDILDIKKGNILVMVQSPSEYPNYFVRNIKSNKSTALTNFENPFKGIKDVHKEVIQYKREDGVQLSGTLYLPAGYDRKAKTEKLPLLIWAYPTEYKDKATAGMSKQNPNSFTYPYYGSFVYWVAKGYAVLDDASFPIVGEGDNEPNDNFIEQLVANGKAAIDAVDNLGFIDRSRVGVGGHSYGAFMTANLLSHSDLFACGIARSGAYNRTLTPFGFQSEQRNYWDNPDLYNTMSPFMNADKMKTPMLLVHGEEDNNSGTYTEQTKRYFDALKNLGAPVRMVLLPKESHGYVARENILHLLWEQDVFLEKYLKGEKGKED